MSVRFGELINRIANERGLKDYHLQSLFGAVIVDGEIKGYQAKQVNRLRAGDVRYVEDWVVRRFIEVLNLDWWEAWAAAGRTPPEVTAEDYRFLEQLDALDPDRDRDEIVRAVKRHQSVGRGPRRPALGGAAAAIAEAPVAAVDAAATETVSPAQRPLQPANSESVLRTEYASKPAHTTTTRPPDSLPRAA